MSHLRSRRRRSSRIINVTVAHRSSPSRSFGSRRSAYLAVIILFSSSGLVLTAFQEPSRPGVSTEEPEETKPQPIPFSHKIHCLLSQDCLVCHDMPSPGSSMGYPPTDKCMECHETVKADSASIKKLADYHNQNKPVPWVRIYRVPDYVYFSHKVHFKNAKIDCEVCHGPVAERDVITTEKPTTMTACMDCHKEHGAPVRCNTCHNPHP